MEITKGVRLHFIQSEKFKTNKIRVRFSAPMSKETVAGRVLTASMLETVNAVYPTSQAFRERLANLYGADYSTSLSRRGLVHYLDINLSFVRDKFLSRKNVLTDAMLDFLKASLFSPLVSQDAFDESAFEIEKKNIFNEVAVREKIQSFNFAPRQQELQLVYQQEYSNVLREGLEQKDVHQSIIELAYHFPIQYGESEHLPLVVLNALLGGFAHSKLFVNLREREGLAYTISSNFDIFSGMMRIYAGIDRSNRTRTVALINRQILDLKRGNFSEEELNQTKKMLRNSVLLAQDRQNTILERAYMASVLGNKFLSLEAWLKALEQVRKDDIIKAAGLLKLQAIYFMEGK